MTLDAALSRDLLERDELIDTLASLVRARSENPPGDEAVAAELAAARCRELGLEVSLYEGEPGRPSVVARWGDGAGPVVTYCSHIDVVPAGNPDLWEHDPYEAIVADGSMHGRGTSDAKGPCAAALQGVAIMRRAGLSFPGTLVLSFVADEESGGFKGAAPLVERGVLGGDVAIVGEPTSLRVVRAQRGIAWLKVITHGRAGHGSAPERGVNAIKHMAEVISQLEATIPDIEHPLLGRPTVSVGTIHGGDKLNMIPAHCVIEIDRRIVPGEDQASMLTTIDDAIKLARDRYPEIDSEVQVVGFGEPFETPADSRLVRTAVAAITEVSGAPSQVTGFRGASDARFFAAGGSEVIVCGPGDISLAHTARESIDLDQLATGAAAYALLFARLLGAS